MIWHKSSFCSFVEKTYRLHLEDALTPQMNKNFKNIVGRKKSLLNPLLLSIVSKPHFLPGSIPWGPCLVPRPSCSRNCHLYTVHTCSNKPGSRAGHGTRMWDSPWSHLPVPEHQGSKAPAVFLHNKMQGDSVEGKGKSGWLCNTACSLCCSFSLKMLFDHRSKIIHLRHLPPFRAAEMFLGCCAKPEAAQHSKSCELWTAPATTELTLMPTREAIQTV